MSSSCSDLRHSQINEVNRAAKFYFPNYATQKQKTVIIPASSDSNTKPYKLSAATKSGTVENRTPKQVSFVEDSNACPVQKPVSPKNLTTVTTTVTLAEQNPAPSGLVLTTKNLEMYNSLTTVSELSLPSTEDNRIANWIKDRQNWVGEPCEDIPEVDENINSASPHDNSSQSVSSVG